MLLYCWLSEPVKSGRPQTERANLLSISEEADFPVGWLALVFIQRGYCYVSNPPFYRSGLVNCSRMESERRE